MLPDREPFACSQTSFPHLTVILLQPGTGWSPITLRCEQHHCRHMASRSQKTLQSMLCYTSYTVTSSSLITRAHRNIMHTRISEYTVNLIYLHWRYAVHSCPCTTSTGMQGAAYAHKHHSAESTSSTYRDIFLVCVLDMSLRMQSTKKESFDPFSCKMIYVRKNWKGKVNR